MKIIVEEERKVSPFDSLFSPKNKTGKQVLQAMENNYFSSTDLYILRKLGYKIISKNTHK